MALTLPSTEAPGPSLVFKIDQYLVSNINSLHLIIMCIYIYNYIVYDTVYFTQNHFWHVHLGLLIIKIDCLQCVYILHCTVYIYINNKYINIYIYTYTCILMCQFDLKLNTSLQTLDWQGLGNICLLALHRRRK